MLLRTRILSRNVVLVRRELLLAALLAMIAGCSGLPALTPGILTQAEEKWSARKPAFYSLVVEMSGDRVETGRFEVEVRSGHTVSLRRNGLVISQTPDRTIRWRGFFECLNRNSVLQKSQR